MNQEHVLPQLLLRAWPFPRGAGLLIQKFFRQLSFSTSEVMIATTDGFHLTVNPNDLIGRHLYLSGEFDRTIPKILIDHAKSGDVLLDIGANIGYVSACFLQNVSGSSVIAVEPQPGTVDILRKNLSQFGNRTLVANVALSDVGGERPFIIDSNNTGGSRLATTEEQADTKVIVQSCNEFFAAMNLKKLDLVKIDIEGHEFPVIKAAIDHFDRLQPRLIIFEDSSGSIAAITKLFATIGYDVFAIKKRLTRISLLKEGSNAHDYVAFSRQYRTTAAPCF